jgi:hypothetical protein
MDYNSKGWQRFRKMVPYNVRLCIAWPIWVFLLIVCVIGGAFVGAWREAASEYRSAQKYWPRGHK